MYCRRRRKRSRKNKSSEKIQGSVPEFLLFFHFVPDQYFKPDLQIIEQSGVAKMNFQRALRLGSGNIRAEIFMIYFIGSIREVMCEMLFGQPVHPSFFGLREIVLDDV